MKTKSHSNTRNLVLSALFVALGFVLPMVTGHVPQIGNMLCPMHLPVLLCGFVCGGPWGLAVGFVTPLLRSLAFGMPPLFPTAVAMAFELATYGAVSGVLYRKAKRHTLPMIYAVLVTAMVAGRLVWGAVRFVLAGLTGSSFPFSAFLSGAVLTAVPGIIAQLILIPLILVALQRAKLME
jgi:riboflavin transporter FmnP